MPTARVHRSWFSGGPAHTGARGGERCDCLPHGQSTRKLPFLGCLCGPDSQWHYHCPPGVAVGANRSRTRGHHRPWPHLHSDLHHRTDRGRPNPDGESRPRLIALSVRVGLVASAATPGDHPGSFRHGDHVDSFYRRADRVEPVGRCAAGSFPGRRPVHCGGDIVGRRRIGAARFRQLTTVVSAYRHCGGLRCSESTTFTRLSTLLGSVSRSASGEAST